MVNLNSSQRKKGNDCIYTPEWVALDMVNHFKPEGLILDPCKGKGVFTDILENSEWCEITEGRDFFDWARPVDWIISNPPFSLMRKFILHSFTVADDIVYLVPVWKIYLAYGLVLKGKEYGGIKEIRWYGTGSKLGFPMGNGIGAVHWKRGYTGGLHDTFYKDAIFEAQPGV